MAAAEHENRSAEEGAAKESIWSLAFGILLATNFFQSMAAFMANATLPLYADSVGVRASMVGVIISAFALTALLIRPFAGPAFDSFSRKKMLMGAQGIIALAFISYGFAKTVPALIAVRLLHGIGIGCAGPLGMSLVSEYLPRSRFASGVSIYMIAQSVAQVIGPAVGLVLIEIIGFQFTYLISAAFLCASILCIGMLTEVPREKPPYKIKLNRMFAREAFEPSIVLMLFAAAFGGTTSYLVLYATKLGITNIGLYFTAYAICLLVTRPVFGRLADRFGAERILIPGVLCFAASYLILPHITNLTGLISVALVAACGFGSCVPLIQSIAMGSVSIERRGAASNTTFTGMDIGSLLGPLLAGGAIEVLEPAMGSLLSAYSHMWYVMIIPQALAFILILKWNISKKKTLAETAVNEKGEAHESSDD